MASSTHFVEQEELMAYLDGELAIDRATQVAKHLEQCAECRVSVAESRALSERLSGWQVEPAPLLLSERVTAAVHAGEIIPQAREIPALAPPRRKMFGLPRWVWATAGAACVFLLVGAVTISNMQRSPSGAYRASSVAPMKEEMAYAPSPNPATPASVSMNLPQTRSNDAGPGGGGAESPSITGPMIVRTASLTLLTKDFGETRARLEEVVRRHRGYNGQLTVSSETGSARTLSATFRVPADQLDAAIAEIKQIAHVEQESQGGEEVTEQYVDLTARLSNARRTEQQLLDILDKRTGKLSDVLEVEQELARVREQIERMEAELKNLQNRVSFSTLQVELREEYKAELRMPTSLGGRLWNALVEGFRTAAMSLVGVVMVVLNVGPVLLLWALILAWPVVFVWRRVRARRAQK